MRTLVIHPDDPSTADLRILYAPRADATVLVSDTPKDEVRALIAQHERVILCGHGHVDGLYSVGRFPTDNGFIIDASMVEVLAHKRDTIYLWCYAHDFVRRHGLRGFSSGMFISEVREAGWMGLPGITQAQVDESTRTFCALVAQHLHAPLEALHAAVLRDYGRLAAHNPVAAYNHARLSLHA